MDWYYEKDNQQAGPVSREELERLLRGGTISATNLVWNQDMPDWKPAGETLGIDDIPALSPADSPAPDQLTQGAPSSPLTTTSEPLSAAPAQTAPPSPSFSQGPGLAPSTGTVPRDSGAGSLAIWSFVLSLVGFFVCPFLAQIPAVICGHLALSRIKNSPGPTEGKGLALAGVIIGYAGMLLWIVGVAINILLFLAQLAALEAQ